MVEENSRVCRRSLLLACCHQEGSAEPVQGLPHADAAAILKQGFGLIMSRSGICRAIQRTARKAEATWQALREAARRSELAHMDETGWKVEAQLRWLWAVVTDQITFCEILPGRGFAQAASILGAEYAGWLIHDGWRVYYKFLQAAHQSCVEHLMRRCRDMAEMATPAAARFPLAVKELLQQGLSLRDRYLGQEISLHGLWTATGRLEVKLDRLLERRYQEPAKAYFRSGSSGPNRCTCDISKSSYCAYPLSSAALRNSCGPVKIITVPHHLL